MLAILSFLFVLALSLFILKVGTKALMLTGVSYELASFQALSAFTGTGFTTRETESVVNHPARRRILRDLLILGNMGGISAIASAILSFGSLAQAETRVYGILLLLGGILFLFLLALSPRVDRLLQGAIEWSLRHFTDLEVQDYSSLLRLEGGYRVSEIQIEEGSWLADKSLLELRLGDEGVWVLGISRPNGAYLGVPRPGTRVGVGDRIIAYGRALRLEELAERRAGEEGRGPHEDALREQRALKEEIDRVDRKRAPLPEEEEEDPAASPGPPP